MDDTSITQVTSPPRQLSKTNSSLIGTLSAWSLVPCLYPADTNLEISYYLKSSSPEPVGRY